MIRWIRLVVSPAVLLGMGFFEFICVASHYLVDYFTGDMPGMTAQTEQLALSQLSPLFAFYGGFRILSAHPLVRPSYRNWLMRTPWHPGMRLPLGPLPLVLQDAFVVLSIALPGFAIVGTSIALPLTFFFGAYQLTLCYFLFYYGPRRWAYLQLFLLVTVFLAYSSSMFLALGVAAAGYPLALHALRKHVGLYPWSGYAVSWEFQRLSPGYQHLLPNFRPPLLTGRDGLCIGPIVGWFVLALMSAIHTFGKLNDNDAGVGVGLLMVGLLLATMKLASFVVGYAPPITIWARLRTGRPIIPGYDIAFVSPLAALFCAGVLPDILRLFGVPALVAYPASATLGIFCLFGIGPTLLKWRLTAPVKIQFCLSGSWLAKLARTAEANAANKGARDR